LELDVTDERSVDSAISVIVVREGRLDVVVNNAGIATVGLTEAFTVEDVHKLFNTNLLGPVRVNRAVLPQMRKQGSGQLIYISSIAGRLVVPNLGVYGASKFALESYAEGLRYEVAPLGISSVVIEPGAFPTQLMGKMGSPSDLSRVENYGPAGKISQALVEGFEAAFSGEDAPDPKAVSDAIVSAIEGDPDETPFRIAVGADAAPVTEVNFVAEKAQNSLLENFGLGEFVSGSATGAINANHAVNAVNAASTATAA
jgi:NAD(P)-dependent dehydrogenase (short-subunit alcohol dehydrogenase family)